VTRARRRRLGLVGLLSVVVLSGCQSGRAVGVHPVERVLVVSLPGVAWQDVRDGHLPALGRLADRSAIGDLSTRIGRRGASTTDAYLSIGAGTRAIAPRVDVAVALDPDESYGGVHTADILERRLGRVPSGVAYLAVGAARDLNESSAFGAEPGRLGDLLAHAGVSRAVVANADAVEGFVSDEPPPDGSYARGAATALMGSDGIVPRGTVGRTLLEDDPLAPFGRRLDHDAVLAAFDEAWAAPGRSVVLVEASDLSRAAGYLARATPAHGWALRAEALASSDALLEQLLTRVDPRHDAVLVVSPVAAPSSPELAVALLQAPGAHGGLLRSSTTRRDGYVQLADVAPTILGLLGEPQPAEIEGRRFEVKSDRRSERITRLTDEATAAEFRDELMPIVVPLVIGALAVLAGVTIITVRRARLDDGLPRGGPGGRWSVLLCPLALVALGVVPATFAAARWPALVGRTGVYLIAVMILAIIVGLVAWLAERRWAGAGALVGTASIVALFTVDVLAGAPLQLNAVFGYSVAVAGRFAGLGNLAFALFGSATVVLACLAVDRWGRPALPWALALLAGVVLLEGLPMLGADVGGVLSMVPAFGVTALVLSGRRVGLAQVAGLAAASVGAVLVFAFIDVSRPVGSRTHLARLAENLVDGRSGPFVDSLTRRLQASFGDAELGAWALLIALVVVVGGYTVLVAQGRIEPGRLLERGHRPTAAAAAGMAVLASVGLVANDSSIAVPATMLIVVAPVLVLRAMADLRAVPRVDMEAP
jgi:hypothetical protein